MEQTIGHQKTNLPLELNEGILDRLPGTARCCFSIDKVVCDNEEEARNYPLEFLNSLTPSGMPKHCLRLKPGCIIMLLCNLDIWNGICNGTRFVVRRLHDRCIDAEVLSTSQSGKRILIPRIGLAPNDVNLPFILERCQFPVRLAYSMTINRPRDRHLVLLGFTFHSQYLHMGNCMLPFLMPEHLPIHTCV